MTKSALYNELIGFIKPHPYYHPRGESVYVPPEKSKLKLWFEGGLQVEGSEHTLKINFNDQRFLILAVTEDSSERIIRVPWKRFVAYELINEKEPNDVAFPKVFLN